MEQFMGFMPERFHQELFVDLLNFRVFVRFSERHPQVFFINCMFPFIPNLLVGGNGLSAATEASAGTSHDLYKMVVDLPFFYILHYLFGIGQAIGHHAL